MTSDVLPGSRVRLPERPEWGVGQVQSVIGDRVTVNFEGAGKVTIRGAERLVPAEEGR